MLISPEELAQKILTEKDFLFLYDFLNISIRCFATIIDSEGAEWTEKERGCLQQATALIDLGMQSLNQLITEEMRAEKQNNKNTHDINLSDAINIVFLPDGIKASRFFGKLQEGFDAELQSKFQAITDQMKNFERMDK